MRKIFKNREEAGRELADMLMQFKEQENTLVLALPRGGVPVAYAIAKRLNLPWDILLVRKLGVPFHEELAMGAIAWDHICILNHDVIHQFKITDQDIKQEIEQEQKELARRNRLYRQSAAPPHVEGKTVIVVDDGLATGATMRAAISVLRQAKADHIIIAVPVCAQQACEEFKDLVDEVICLLKPDNFYAVGYYYRDFTQLSDNDVLKIMTE